MIEQLGIESTQVSDSVGINYAIVERNRNVLLVWCIWINK
jgi:hypothetical protein